VEIFSADEMFFLQKSNLFAGLSAGELSRITPLLKKIQIQNKKYIIHEGEISDKIYIIYHGEVEILKRDPLTKRNFVISHLTAGAILGEISLLDNAPRSASVRAKGKTTLFTLSISELHRLRTISIEQHDFTYFKIIENIATNLEKQIRITNDVIVKTLNRELEHVRARVSMGIIIVTITIIMVVYLFTMGILSIIYAQTGAGGVIIVIVISVIVLLAIKRMGYPPATFGITTKNWQIAVKEALFATLILILAVVMLKWLMLQWAPSYHSRTLFEFSLANNFRRSVILSIVGLLLYILLVPFQELIIRGALQGPLEDFLIGPHKVFWAILMSNILFSVTHIHLSIEFASVTFVAGLVWGWLYSRNRTLIGVSISHIITAIWTFNIVGL